MQAAATFEETRFLLSVADATPWVAGVVGWVDFDGDSQTLESQLDHLAQHAKAVGVRPMIQDIPDPDWMLAPERGTGFEMLIERDLRFDALVRPIHLPGLLVLLERHPELRIVIDHGAKPEIAGGGLEPWAGDLGRVASGTSACCKLSGLPGEASPDWNDESLAPYVDVLLDGFGAQRLLWGSDWPVVELAGGFEAWWNASHRLLEGLDDVQRAGIFGENARRFYGLPGLALSGLG